MRIKPQVPYTNIDVKTPTGEKTNLLPRKDNSFVFTRTDSSGVYEVSDPASGSVDQLFAVNLLDRTESDLSVKSELNLGYEKVDGTYSTAEARKDYWTWLILAALVVISIEWFIYNRRVFI